MWMWITYANFDSQSFYDLEVIALIKCLQRYSHLWWYSSFSMFLFERDSHLPLSSSDLDHHELVQLLAQICAHSCGLDLSSCLCENIPCKYHHREVKTLEYMFGCMDTIRSKMSRHSSLNKEVVEDRIMNSKAGGKKTFTKWQVPSIVFSFAFSLLHQRPFNKVW